MLTQKSLSYLSIALGVALLITGGIYVRSVNPWVIIPFVFATVGLIMGGGISLSEIDRKERHHERQCMVDNYISDIKKLDDTQLLRRLIDYKSLPDWKVTALNMEGTTRWVKLLQQIKENIGDKS